MACQRSGSYATDPAKGWVLRQTNIGHTLGSAQEGPPVSRSTVKTSGTCSVDNYRSVASGARYGYNLLEADNLDSENPWSILKADDYFLTANTKHGGIVSLTKAQYDAIRAADAKASDNADLKAEDVTVNRVLPIRTSLPSCRRRSRSLLPTVTALPSAT